MDKQDHILLARQTHTGGSLPGAANLETEATECPFCGGECLRVYKWRTFTVLQCKTCKTGTVHPMPTREFLHEYYNNFNPNLERNKEQMVKRTKGLYVELGLPSSSNRKMLDIGGGGGYFCLAYETLGYGKSHYVDLDPRACQFAREHLGLERVYNCDISELGNHLGHNKFHFIYSRHVAEHLIQPDRFIKDAVALLEKDGIFVMHVPNGDSLEFLGYRYLIKNRIRNIKKFNGYTTWKTLSTLVRGGMLQGIDPPRHIWALTAKGIRLWAAKNNVETAIYNRNFSDKRYTPHFNMDSNLKRSFYTTLGKFWGIFRGGVHLVAVFKQIS